jgi:hypothetical protein
MEAASLHGECIRPRNKADWADMAFVVIVGLIAALLKILGAVKPDMQISLHTENTAASVLVMGYVIARARRNPEKLDEWGLSTRLTFPAIVTGLLLIALAVGFRVVESMAVGGKVILEPFLASQALEYTLSAFPQ